MAAALPTATKRLPVTEQAIRRTLIAAGHGTVHTDTHGGDGLLGFATYRLSGTGAIVVSFGCDSPRYFARHDASADLIALLRPAMLDSYRRTLEEAGYTNILAYAGVLRIDH